MPKIPQKLKKLFKSLWLNGSLTSRTCLTWSFSKWLPTKRIEKGAWGHQKIAAAGKLCGACLGWTMNQLKNGFSTQDVSFGSIATVSLIDNGR